jgi:DNA-binding MarR family transcriptional regulator
MATRLQRDLKKKMAFACPEEELYLNILRTGDRLQIHFERLFREFGLTPAQYNILRILRGAGKPLPILEIASRTITAVPGITGLIDRLEKAAFVERKRCPEDRRVIFVALTANGLKTLAEIDVPIIDLHRRLLGHLSRSETSEGIRILEKCRTELDDMR